MRSATSEAESLGEADEVDLGSVRGVRRLSRTPVTSDTGVSISIGSDQAGRSSVWLQHSRTRWWSNPVRSAGSCGDGDAKRHCPCRYSSTQTGGTEGKGETGSRHARLGGCASAGLFLTAVGLGICEASRLMLVNSRPTQSLGPGCFAAQQLVGLHLRIKTGAEAGLPHVLEHTAASHGELSNRCDEATRMHSLGYLKQLPHPTRHHITFSSGPASRYFSAPFPPSLPFLFSLFHFPSRRLLCRSPRQFVLGHLR